MIRTILTAAALIVVATAASAQTVDGAAVYEKSCASCHTNPAQGSRAPTREILAQNAPEAVLTSLMSGKMFQQGGALTEAERRAVAAFIAGRPLGASTPLPSVGRCTASPRALTAANISRDGAGGVAAWRTRDTPPPIAAASRPRWCRSSN